MKLTLLFTNFLSAVTTARRQSSIAQAFNLCGTNGTIVFTNYTFHVNSVLNTTNLVNVNVELYGTLLFSTNVPYWLSHSIPVTFQDQHTAWLFGGANVTFRAYGGRFDGNGQTWYDENMNHANQPGRPITITFYDSTNLLVDGLTIIQPQFWATFVSYSSNVTMLNMQVNATSNSEWITDNTDGLDTWNSRDIVVRNWIVTNGDDCVAAKGNTTNLLVQNVTCHGGAGMTIGSVGQYPLTPDYVENVTFEDINLIDCFEGAYIKTWQATPEDTTGNGDAGGGGSGYVKDITFRNFNLTNIALPIQISQCIYVSNPATCDTSNMAVSNITWANFTGTSTYNVGASLFCSANHPCPDIYFSDVNITSVNKTEGLPLWNTTLQNEVYQCANILNANTTSGIGCNHVAPNDFAQFVSANVP